MHYLTLGQSTIKVPRIGFGCGPMGGYDFGAVVFEDLARAVPLALDQGLNFFDVADIYGLGAAEEFLGKALGTARSRAIIATKFGVRRTPEGTSYYDNSTLWLKQAIEQSLRRLKTSYIDLYQIHYRDKVTPWNELLAALDQLRQEGKIRAVGLSNVTAADLSPEPLPSWVVSLQREFSLACPELAPEINELSVNRDLTPLCYGCLGQGILSAAYNRETVFEAADRRSNPKYHNFHGSTFERNLRIVEVLKSIARAHERTPAQVALNWVTTQLSNAVAIVGIKSCLQLEQAAQALDFVLSSHELTQLDQVAHSKSVE